MKFKELGLSNKILEALEEIGYEEATPIQEASIPSILKGKDIVGNAQTGTGKTAAFALPLIDNLIKNNIKSKEIKILILSPTRELALQINENIVNYISKTTYKSGVILGGVKEGAQVSMLARGIDILVSTPGRLLDLIKQKKADITKVKMLVLDEADTMLDMGFIKDIKSIISYVPKDRQTLLFSATMPEEIKELSVQFMNNPLTIKVNSNEITVDKINQQLYYVDTVNKLPLLLDIIDSKEKPTTLIFTRTKRGANKLEEELLAYSIKASVIHGNKTQSNRVKALSDFKTKKNRIMIATDIAARGIDINDLELVINYDMPEKAELYVHRIGRTARAGKDGIAISFCASSELVELKAVEKILKKSIPVVSHKYPMVLKEERKTHKGRNASSHSRSNQERKFSKPKENRTEKKSYNKIDASTRSRVESKERLYTKTNTSSKRTTYSNKNNKSSDFKRSENNSSRGGFSNRLSGNFKNKKREFKKYTA